MRMRRAERGRVYWCDTIHTLHGGAYLKRKMVYLNESFSLTYIILEHSAIGIYLTRDLIDTKYIIILTHLIIFVIF